MVPSSKYDDIVWGGYGMLYTAPANGYVTLSTAHTQATQKNTLVNTTTQMRVESVSYYTDIIQDYSWCSVTLPVKKGDVVSIETTPHTCIIRYLRFIYAEGTY